MPEKERFRPFHLPFKGQNQNCKQKRENKAFNFGTGNFVTKRGNHYAWSHKTHSEKGTRSKKKAKGILADPTPKADRPISQKVATSQMKFHACARA